MNRRGFIKLFGLAPLLGLARTLPLCGNAGLSLYKYDPELFEWQDSAKKFTAKLEREGKLEFNESIEVLPGKSWCTQLRHVHALPDGNSIDRVAWLDAEDGTITINNIREQTRQSLRRYWAQQARWKRKLERARS